jgi:hypothetical protein
MRQRAYSFASSAFILLIIAGPLAARPLEGSVRLVCELQKTQTETRHLAPSEWSRLVLGESQLERVDVTVVASKDQMTISGTGSEINFSFSSVSGDQIINQGSSWSFVHTATEGAGSEIVQIWDQVSVDGPTKKPGAFFYSHMEGLRRTSQVGPSSGQKDLDQKKGSLRQTLIMGKCRN